jgi:hypothetical protein
MYAFLFGCPPFSSTHVVPLTVCYSLHEEGIVDVLWFFSFLMRVVFLSAVLVFECMRGLSQGRLCLSPLGFAKNFKKALLRKETLGKHPPEADCKKTKTPALRSRRLCLP